LVITNLTRHDQGIHADFEDAFVMLHGLQALYFDVKGLQGESPVFWLQGIVLLEWGSGPGWVQPGLSQPCGQWIRSGPRTQGELPLGAAAGVLAVQLLMFVPCLPSAKPFTRTSFFGQLQKHAQFFAEAVETYHDKGGVTWTRAPMLANTEKSGCGNSCRELVEGSFCVHPIKDFGATAQGVHKFCPVKAGACKGAAEFLIAWRQQGNPWRITRVLSFGRLSA
jgi:hypothetical protein